MSTLSRINPPSLPHSPAFSQGVLAQGSRTLYIGGQNGIDEHDTMAEGIAAQSAQAMRNVLAVVAEAGGGPEHIATLTIHLVEGQDLMAAYQASSTAWDPQPTAVTVLIVAGLGKPGALVEINGVAVLP